MLTHQVVSFSVLYFCIERMLNA